MLGRLNLPGSSPVGVHLLFGPSFNFKLSETFDPDEGDDTEDQFETVETSLVIGGGVHVSRFRIELRYGMGLSNIVKDSVSEGFFTGKKPALVLRNRPGFVASSRNRRRPCVVRSRPPISLIYWEF